MGGKPCGWCLVSRRAREVNMQIIDEEANRLVREREKRAQRVQRPSSTCVVSSDPSKFPYYARGGELVPLSDAARLKIQRHIDAIGGALR